MKVKIKNYLSDWPEMLFILSMMLYWFFTAIENVFPPLFILMLMGGVYLRKNLVTTIISAIFLMFSAYLVWAMIAYTNKYAGKTNVSACLGWAMYFVINVVLSFVLLFKYLFSYEWGKYKQNMSARHS